jgi:hypothetical protein
VVGQAILSPAVGIAQQAGEKIAHPTISSV